jgi:hypothetical protein
MDFKVVKIEDKFGCSFSEIIDRAEAIAANVAYEEKWGYSYDYEIVKESDEMLKVYSVRVFKR